MYDQDPLVSGTIRRRVDAFTGSDHYRFTIDGIEYDGHWAHDTRRLLDENARLNTENERIRSMTKLHRESVARQRHKLEQKLIGWREAAEKARAELDKVIREAAADKAKLAAVRAEAESWNLTDKQIDLMSSDSNPVRRAEQWLKLTTMRACAQDVEAVLLAAPEMPRPPAEEAPTEYRCPRCERWALWTDGEMATATKSPTFWCQTCSAETPLESMDSRPQERAGDAGTPGTGLDTQDRQNGAEASENEEPSYGT